MLRSLNVLHSSKSDCQLLKISPLTNDSNFTDSSTAPTNKLINSELEDRFSVPGPWSCKCAYQQPDFCPYCDYDQSIQFAASHSIISSASSPVLDTASAVSHQQAPNSTSRRRKLRKLRPDTQQLQYEVLNVEAVIAARPDSVLSIDSRTPLLDTHLKSNPNYLPLPSLPRTPNKLEKRGKRNRSTSVSGSSFFTLGSGSSHSINRKIVRSKSFLVPKKAEVIGPRPHPIFSSIHTDALVSLAWTGEATSPTMVSQLLLDCPDGSDGVCPPNSILTPDSVIEFSTKSIPNLPSEARRSVLRKQKDPAIQNLSPKRPWTLAMVITDDGITDERLVHDLENMRIKASDAIDSDLYPLGLGPPPPSSYQTQLYDSYAEYPPEAGEIILEDPISPSDSSWNSARQVLLLCRELVRTERRYLASLKTLITNGTNTPPPPLMLPYIPGLIAASEKLLEMIEKNPSAQGVSEALLACEPSLNEAFINWCSVVGQFFVSGDDSKLKTKSNEHLDTASSGKLSTPHSLAPSMRTRSAESTLSIVIPEPNKIRRNTKSRPTVRDLAILPTQRIMRYVLLFKELYSLTPTTLPSFATVERALQVAESIAHLADEAQGHSAFKPVPPKSFEYI